MPRRLYLVRHGETEANASKKLHKNEDFNELNETGLKQIQEAGEKIKSYKPDVISFPYIHRLLSC